MADDRDLRISPHLVIPASELTWRFSASGGPGGQHVNTSNTRVELSLDIAGSPTLDEHLRERLIRRLGPSVRVVASERRSQLKNRDLASSRLVDLLREALIEPTVRKKTRPTLASKRRRLDAKRRQGELKRSRSGRYAD